MDMVGVEPWWWRGCKWIWRVWSPVEVADPAFPLWVPTLLGVWSC